MGRGAAAEEEEEQTLGLPCVAFLRERERVSCVSSFAEREYSEKGTRMDILRKKQLQNPFSGQTLNKSRKFVYVYLNRINRGKIILYGEKISFISNMNRFF